jgi:hypothetical protein
MTGSERTAIGWAMQTSAAESIGRAASSRTLLDRLSIALVAAVVALISIYTWVRPDYNWDMVAYIATALESQTSNPVELHAETWKEVGKGASEANLYHLQYGNPYNRHQWENPVDFQSQLSMYRVKVAYIGLLRALAPVAGLANASILLSILPSIAFGALCLVWLKRENAIQGALIVTPMLIIADYLHMTTAVTPDMLAAVTSLTAIYLLAVRRDIAACLLLLASVFVRPDSLILIFALLVSAVIFGWRKIPLLVTFVAAFAVCVAISQYTGHPGWWAHFYFSCVQIQNSMVNFSPDFSMIDFVRGYARGVMVAVLDNDWPALLILFAATWALLHRAGKTGRGRENALMFALMIGTLGRFASFPLPDNRIYFVFMAGMAILLVTMLKPCFDRTVPAGS